MHLACEEGGVEGAGEGGVLVLRVLGGEERLGLVQVELGEVLACELLDPHVGRHLLLERLVLQANLLLWLVGFKQKGAGRGGRGGQN